MTRGNLLADDRPREDLRLDLRDRQRELGARGLTLTRTLIRSLLMRLPIVAVFAIACIGSLPALATGLATCDSGPKSGWQPVEKLEKQLSERGWNIRRIKEDGGCYEVYALDERGQRVEAYFHPVTLAPVPTTPR